MIICLKKYGRVLTLIEKVFYREPFAFDRAAVDLDRTHVLCRMPIHVWKYYLFIDNI